MAVLGLLRVRCIQSGKQCMLVGLDTPHVQQPRGCFPLDLPPLGGYDHSHG